MPFGTCTNNFTYSKIAKYMNTLNASFLPRQLQMQAVTVFMTTFFLVHVKILNLCLSHYNA